MLTRQKSFQNDNPKLYLVGTPIGNYDDMTFRAVDTLKNVDIIYCEDTRISSMLLKHFNISTKLKSYNVVTENNLTQGLIEDIKNGKNVAVISDAGLPSISDPGYLAAVNAVKEGIDVIVIPGVSASLTALVGSSLTTNSFTFYGFLNSKKNQRIKELELLKDISNTLIIYEAPHRIKDTLTDLLNIFGNRYICLARELTKKYEEYLRGNILDILEIVDELKGEMVLIIEGKKIDEITLKLNELSLEDHYNYYLNLTNDPKLSYKKVANDLGISKSIVYNKLNKK